MLFQLDICRDSMALMTPSPQALLKYIRCVTKAPLKREKQEVIHWVHTFIWKTEGSAREWTQSPRCFSHMCMLNRASSCCTSPQLQPGETTKTNCDNCTRQASTKSAPWLGKQWASQRKCEPWDLKLPGWVTSSWPKPTWGITPRLPLRDI